MYLSQWCSCRDKIHLTRMMLNSIDLSIVLNYMLDHDSITEGLIVLLDCVDGLKRFVFLILLVVG